MKIIQAEDEFTIANVTETYDALPKGVYMLGYNSLKQFYFLKKKEDFILPKKTYGEFSCVDRWLTSYNENSEKNLGIILSGIKGSGKTITSQKFCIDSGLPIIIINEMFVGSGFIDFLTSPVMSNVIIFLDEFEKIYPDQSKQKDLLSLMDGTYQTKLIFLLTVNDFVLNEYLVNRLNRIKYRKHYMRLDDVTINEVIDDMLINKEHRQSIFEFFDKVNMSTFDLLVNLIKDMNLFNEDAISCGKHFNLKSEKKYCSIFEIMDGKEYSCYSANASIHDSEIDVNRKTMSYVTKATKNVSTLRLTLKECEIEKIDKDTFIVSDTARNIKFKFIEEPKNAMLF